jgi:hypothetical protein
MERTQRSEMLAFKLQTQVNHPEGSTQHSEHGKSLKSRIRLVTGVNVLKLTLYFGCTPRVSVLRIL